MLLGGRRSGRADRLLVEESVGKKEDFAKDPLGLGESAEKPKGKRITEANKEYGTYTGCFRHERIDMKY